MTHLLTDKTNKTPLTASDAWPFFILDTVKVSQENKQQNSEAEENEVRLPVIVSDLTL